MTQTNEAWGGGPFNVDDKPRVRLGPGVFIEELEKALKARGINYKIIDVAPMLIYPPYRVPQADIYPDEKEEAIREIEEFLNERLKE